MRLQYTKQNRLKNEGGVYIVIVACGALALMTLVALAINVGFIRRTQMNFQNSLDAGVVSGAQLLLTQPDWQKVNSWTQDLMAENLSRMGIDPAKAAVNPLQITSDGSELSVNGQVSQTNFILAGLPDIQIGAHSKAINFPVRVTLVLDDSKSMTAPVCPTCSTTRNQAVKDASNYLIDHLRPIDSVAVVDFSGRRGTMPQSECNGSNDDATVISGMTRLANNDVKNAVKDLINKNLVACGGTNMLAGLQLAKDQFPADRGKARDIILLVTDGVPTRDLTLDPFGYDPGYNEQAGLLTHCLDDNKNRFGTTKTDGIVVTPPKTNNTNYQETTHRRRMLHVLQLADQLREQNNITLYTIGVGTLDTDETDPTFQARFNWNVPDDDFSGDNVKPYFLRRLANDQSAMRHYSSPDKCPNPDGYPYCYDFPCLHSGAKIANDLQGEYAYAGDGVQLTQIFGHIAYTIKSRLSQ